MATRSPSHPSTARLTTSFAPGDPEWRRVSVRDARDALMDPLYLERLHLSMVEVFQPWWEGRGVTADWDAFAMLRAQHRLLIDGREGGRQYVGASPWDENFSKKIVVPAGQLFAESKPEAEPSFSFLRRAKLTAEDSAALDAFLVGKELPPRPAEPQPDFCATILGQGLATQVLRLPRAGVEMRNEIFADYVSHYYPKAAEAPEVFRAMGEVITGLRDAASASLALLAEYVYLGANGHVFVRGNLSMVLAQANFILSAQGKRGISHGHLDYIAMVNDLEYFQKRFSEEVARENP